MEFSDTVRELVSFTNDVKRNRRRAGGAAARGCDGAVRRYLSGVTAVRGVA